jgi:uncharacterized protein (DUF885 family)
MGGPRTVSDQLTEIEPKIVDHFFTLRPQAAVELGLHRYDGKLPDLSRGATEQWIQSAERYLSELGEIEVTSLLPARQLDHLLLRLLLEGALFDLKELRELESNPMSYVLIPTLLTYLTREYAPAADRVAGIEQVLAGVPKLLEAGLQRLQPVLARPFIELAIAIGEGLPSHFQDAQTFADKESTELGRRLSVAREAASSAVLGFVAALRTEYLPRATDDFSLGPARFQRMLWVREGLERSFADLLYAGREDLAANQERLTAIAKQEGKEPKDLLHALSENHPTSESLIPDTRTMVEDLERFVESKKLVTIPRPAICHVQESPSFARGLFTAAMSGPGVFDGPVDGTYWVTPVDPTWTEKAQQEWLRTLNYVSLRNITSHEVYPGHYLNALHTRQFRSSLIRDVYVSPSFVEGWAHYCEQLVIEQGFGQGSVLAEVAQIKDALTRDCRLVASIGLHTQGMTVEQATQLFETEAHLERVHAEREAVRGTFNPEYFCYTLGKLAILEQRSRFLTTKFEGSLLRFHDALLRSGLPPIGALGTILAAA